MDGIAGRIARRGVGAVLLAVLAAARALARAAGQEEPDIEQCKRAVRGPWCVRHRRRARCIRRGQRCCEQFPNVKSREWARCLSRR